MGVGSRKFKDLKQGRNVSFKTTETQRKPLKISPKQTAKDLFLQINL